MEFEIITSSLISPKNIRCYLFKQSFLESAKDLMSELWKTSQDVPFQPSRVGTMKYFIDPFDFVGQHRNCSTALNVRK